MDKIVAEVENRGINYLTFDDEKYPRMLKNIDDIPQECAEAFIEFYTCLFKQPDIPYVWRVEELLQNLIDKFGIGKVSPLVSLARQKRIISDTWSPSFKGGAA